MTGKILAVVLAAGESTRMKSAKSKVLHTIGNRPMISYVIDALGKTGVTNSAKITPASNPVSTSTLRRKGVKNMTFVLSPRSDNRFHFLLGD